MSVELTHYPTSLSPEDVELVRDAHLHWDDSEKFTDSSVDRIKSVAQRVFGLGAGTTLLGVILQDAVVFQQKNDNRLFYALVQKENTDSSRIEWEAMKLDSGEGAIVFCKDAAFRVVLGILDLTRDMKVLEAPVALSPAQ